MGVNRIVRKNLIAQGVVRRVRQEGRWKYIDLRKHNWMPKLPGVNAGTAEGKSVYGKPSARTGRFARSVIAMIRTFVGRLKAIKKLSRPRISGSISSPKIAAGGVTSAAKIPGPTGSTVNPA